MPTAITLLISLLPNLLQELGVIPPGIATLIAQLGGAIPGLITSLASGGSVPDEIVTILGGFQAEIKVLQADTTLSPNALAIAADLDQSLTDAIAAYQKAGSVTDPSTLTPLPTNLQEDETAAL
jgi:hypothetical protein